MIIDLSGIIKDSDSAITICEKSYPEETSFLGESFKFPDGLNVNGKIISDTKSLHFTAKVSGKMLVHCARCQIEIEKPIEYDISEILIRNDGATVSGDDDDVIFFDGNTLDADEIIGNNFLLNASGRYLCKEDCKGLCPICGQDLNIKQCDCCDDEVDPRWAALTEIMKNSDTE